MTRTRLSQALSVGSAHLFMSGTEISMKFKNGMFEFRTFYFGAKTHKMYTLGVTTV